MKTLIKLSLLLFLVPFGVFADVTSPEPTITITNNSQLFAQIVASNGAIVSDKFKGTQTFNVKQICGAQLNSQLCQFAVMGYKSQGFQDEADTKIAHFSVTSVEENGNIIFDYAVCPNIPYNKSNGYSFTGNLTNPTTGKFNFSFS